jgi:sigma-B regulation protein RsbU (phosphoserine phosphatase)
MERGDQLLLYTDGLTEAQNGDGDEFGFERLVALARQFIGPATTDAAGSTNLLTTLREELARFAGGRPLDDDLTLALVRRR